MIPEFIHKLLHLPYLLKVYRRGRGKQTIVFLHGIAANKEVWLPAIESLQRDYTCIAIDLLGHGRSPKPTNVNYTIDEHLRSIRWTLFCHGLWGKKIFAGHSMGALISTHYAATRPKSLARIVLVSMPIYKHSSKDANRLKLETMLDSAYLSFYRALRSAPKQWVIRSAKSLDKHFPSLIGQTTVDDSTWYPLVSSLKYTIEDQPTQRDIDQLSPKLPIDVLYGSLDQLVLASNLKQAFSSHSTIRITKMFAAHEINPRITQAVVKAITHGPPETESSSA
ncbi:MAG: alpha/beta hydrolase [bacterium]